MTLKYLRAVSLLVATLTLTGLKSVALAQEVSDCEDISADLDSLALQDPATSKAYKKYYNNN